MGLPSYNLPSFESNSESTYLISSNLPIVQEENEEIDTLHPQLEELQRKEEHIYQQEQELSQHEKQLIAEEREINQEEKQYHMWHSGQEHSVIIQNNNNYNDSNCGYPQNDEKSDRGDWLSAIVPTSDSSSFLTTTRTAMTTETEEGEGNDKDKQPREEKLSLTQQHVLVVR